MYHLSQASAIEQSVASSPIWLQGFATNAAAVKADWMNDDAMAAFSQQPYAWQIDDGTGAVIAVSKDAACQEASAGDANVLPVSLGQYVMVTGCIAPVPPKGVHVAWKNKMATTASSPAAHAGASSSSSSSALSSLPVWSPLPLGCVVIATQVVPITAGEDVLSAETAWLARLLSLRSSSASSSVAADAAAA